MSHSHWMRHALKAAEAARLTVSPRPWVGCVIVTAAGEVFTGATSGKDGPHAEQNALQAADDTQGATLYSTLEPCDHHGKTPPCCDAIIAAGVAKVVVALTDPDERVSGKGLDKLRQAGIDVLVGVGAAEVEQQLRPYLVHRRLGRPYVTLKLASTLDGRVALADGTSQWITGPEARADAHMLRAESDAVLVGANTVRLDNPKLTVRDAELPGSVSLREVQPKRFVLGRLPDHAADGSVLNLSLSIPEENIAPAQELSGTPAEVLRQLAEQDIMSVLIEGGPTVARAFHDAQLVDRYVFYVAPKLAGGGAAKPVLAGEAAAQMADLWQGKFTGWRQLGADLRIDLEPV